MLRAWYASIHTGVAQNALLIALQAVLVGGALWLWSRGQASAGDVAYVLTSFLLVSRWLRDVGMQLRTAQQAANDMERLIEYHRTPADHHGPARRGTAPGARRRGPLRVGAVPLRQPRGTAVRRPRGRASRPASGWRWSGHSGSGKTTFVKLLQRLHEIQGGPDPDRRPGHRRAPRLASLREAIALVPQEPVLFHRSLAENIAYARPDASQDEIERAARLANAARLHRAAAAGLRHPGRRARRQAVGRRAPAGGDRPGLPGRPADPGPGRGDLLARQRSRAPDPGRARAPDGRPHHARHRAPPVDRPQGRPHPGVRARPDRRAGHASGRCSRGRTGAIAAST